MVSLMPLLQFSGNGYLHYYCHQQHDGLMLLLLGLVLVLVRLLSLLLLWHFGILDHFFTDVPGNLITNNFGCSKYRQMSVSTNILQSLVLFCCHYQRCQYALVFFDYIVFTSHS